MRMMRLVIALLAVSAFATAVPASARTAEGPPEIIAEGSVSLALPPWVAVSTWPMASPQECGRIGLSARHNSSTPRVSIYLKTEHSIAGTMMAIWDLHVAEWDEQSDLPGSWATDIHDWMIDPFPPWTEVEAVYDGFGLKPAVPVPRPGLYKVFLTAWMRAIATVPPSTCTLPDDVARTAATVRVRP